MTKIYVPRVAKFWGHRSLMFKILDQIWCLTSCSQVSGQMSFKNVTERVADFYINSWDSTGKGLDECKNSGVTMDGRVRDVVRTMSQQDMVAPLVNALPFLGMKLDANAFVTSDSRYPVVSDGINSFEVGVFNDYYNTTISRVEIKPMKIKKHYKSIYDPCHLDYEGSLLAPMQKVIDLIDENVEVFADPFSTRNTGRRRPNEVKTIRPGLRQQMRKITGRRRKAVNAITIVDEVTP